MTRFEPGCSGIGNGRTVNSATTTAQERVFRVTKVTTWAVVVAQLVERSAVRIQSSAKKLSIY